MLCCLSLLFGKDRFFNTNNVYIDKHADIEIDVNEGIYQLEHMKSVFKTDVHLGEPSVSMANILEVIYS